MSTTFFKGKCQTFSSNKRFGLCDDPSPIKKPAYIDEMDGSKWIAVVHNDDLQSVIFTAIDNCIDIRKEDGSMSKRCDGVLTYNTSIIFVELKERKALGSAWVRDAEEQLRATIVYFENTGEAEDFTTKKAYIANNEHPKFKESQTLRMEKFLIETGYILRIENRIIL